MKSVSLTHILSRLAPAALALPLCLAAGCMSENSADDETSTASELQSFGNTCHILRNYAWQGVQWNCAEGFVNPPPFDLAAGEIVDVISSPHTGYGDGRVRLTCNADGSWTESRKICGAPGTGTGGN